MTVTRERSVESRSGSTEEAIKDLVSHSLRELERLTLTGELETTSNPSASHSYVHQKKKINQVIWTYFFHILHAELSKMHY